METERPARRFRYSRRNEPGYQDVASVQQTSSGPSRSSAQPNT